MSSATPSFRAPSASGEFVPGDDASERSVLEWAIRQFRADRIAVASAFGPGTTVLLHLLSEIGARLPVIFIDTLYHFPDTLRHVERVSRLYNLDLRVVRPAVDRATFEAVHGPRLWERDLETYQRLTKIEPFRAAIAGLEAYISGRRRDQSPTRATLPVVEPGQPTRINPLAAWTGEDVWRFVHARGLHYNPLHDRGYASIGDAPLTTPVASGEHERAGRWRGLGRLECGIHELAQAPAETS